jgi:D-arginine dehydrogenase
VIIVGGGVAGLSVAALLAPHKRVLLLEREPQLASQASGNNAAIYRPLEQDARSAQLARRSRELLVQLIGPGVHQASGLLLVSQDAAPVAALGRVAAAQGVRHVQLGETDLHARAPSLVGGEARHGLLLLDGGVLDLVALTGGLTRVARARGAELETDVGVTRVTHAAGRVTGVLTADGEQLAAPDVVLAAGAWSATLGAASGFPLPLAPRRRHLVQLEAADFVLSREPVVWRLEDEVYYRSEGHDVLASPCDETPWLAEQPPNDPAELSALTQKLQRLAPSLASAKVRRAWACLRTYAPDGEIVAGADARVQGLHWLAGLGGRGMSVATAAAELLVDSVLGRGESPQRVALAPARFT